MALQMPVYRELTTIESKVFMGMSWRQCLAAVILAAAYNGACKPCGDSRKRIIMFGDISLKALPLFVKSFHFCGQCREVSVLFFIFLADGAEPFFYFLESFFHCFNGHFFIFLSFFAAPFSGSSSSLFMCLPQGSRSAAPAPVTPPPRYIVRLSGTGHSAGAVPALSNSS